MTPGTIGLPGKWPLRYHSSPVKVCSATARTPGSSAVTRRECRGALGRERVDSDRVDEMRRDLARAEQLAREDLLVRRDVRGDADDGEFVERALHPRDGLGAIATPGDDLREQRVVERRDLVALEAVRVDPDAGPTGLEPR